MINARRSLVALLPLLVLQGCSSREDDAEPVSLTSSEVTYFDLTAYEDAEAATDKESITGTWVGSWRYRSSYEQPEGDVLATSPEFFARLDVMVIRRTTNGYEISDCVSGEFVEATLNDGFITSGRGQFSLTDANRLVPPTVSQSYVNDVYDVRFEVTAEGEFVKVADTADAIGSYTGDWTGADDNFSGSIYCAQLDNLQNGGHRFSFGSDDGTHFTMSQRPLITDYDADFEDVANDYSYQRTQGRGDFTLELFDINSDGREDGYTFNFDFTSDADATPAALGQGSVNIPL